MSDALGPDGPVRRGIAVVEPESPPETNGPPPTARRTRRVHRGSAPAAPEILPDRLGPLRSARLRIVASIIALLVISAVGSLIAIRQVLLIRLDSQVTDALDQEIEELNAFVERGRDPQTGRPFTSLADLFDVYFTRNVPAPQEVMYGFVDGRMTDERGQQRFPVSRIRSTVFYEWTARSSDEAPQRVEYVTSGAYVTPKGELGYRVVPVRYRGVPGAFVVAILPAAEVKEIRDMQTYGGLVSAVVLILMGSTAWFLAGRALKPVRQLTITAQQISESDMTRRVDVRGSDEAAQMARSFNAMLDRIERLFHSEREFVDDASHAMRDPLTICMGYLEQLEDAPPEDRRAMIAVISDELDRMGRIVDGLQRLSDAEHPDFLRPEDIDVEPFVHELLVKASALGDRRWILEGEPRGTFRGDRHRLTEAVMNLAHNAVEHTGAGAVVAIGASAGADVRIWVRDEGVGVPVAERERIFDRMTRGDGARRRYRGSGLGLTIVRAIARAHGGDVALRSEEGAGSTFTLILPTGRPGRAT